MRRLQLRTKFLLSMLLVTLSLTFASLLIVRNSVNRQVYRQLDEDLHNSLATFQQFHRQREASLGYSAQLLASLPSLKALMTTRDATTIQDGSGDFRKLSGADLFVLADRSTSVVALHTGSGRFSKGSAQQYFARSLQDGQSQWWFDGERLFQVAVEPIYFGASARNSLLGFLAVGFEVSDNVANEVGRLSGSEVAFQVETAIAASTLSPAQEAELGKTLAAANSPSAVQDLHLGGERFLASSVTVGPAIVPRVALSVLKSYDRATAFVTSLNRLLIGLGICAVLGGFGLVFLISDTFTRPLRELVGGVRALERGDFQYPLAAHCDDEVAEVTRAFEKMRGNLQEAQRQLLTSERLATIGRMASSISHDLRHPLTAVMANSEFLSESNLSAQDREHLYSEIRTAVGQMTDLVDSLLEFSRGRESLHLVDARLDHMIEAAVHAIESRPEFHRVRIAKSFFGDAEWTFDPKKMERAVYNLVLNACEAALLGEGEVKISAHAGPDGVEIIVADTGPGIPEGVRDRLFQPFVTGGKEDGVGLGLTIVRKIVADHGGEVRLQATSPQGTIFRLWLPRHKGSSLDSDHQLDAEHLAHAGRVNSAS
ncbi:MAG: ATP-binding protein [Acidobacteriales bacterium]|nr:ATP-binding protein [Terriglobales bacterium]